MKTSCRQQKFFIFSWFSSQTHVVRPARRSSKIGIMHCLIVALFMFAFGWISAAQNPHIDVLQFGNIIKELKEEMRELRRIRQEDSATISKLEEKIRRFIGSTTEDDENFSSGDGVEGILDAILPFKSSWRNVDGTRNTNREKNNFHDRPSKYTFRDYHPRKSLKSTTDIFREELQRLDKKIEEIKIQKVDGIDTSSGRVAAQWLQRTVHGLRHEMREIATSLNMSATLTDRQRTLTNIGLLKSDVVAIGHRMDSIRVDRERNAAVLIQLREDVDEMRMRLQESAVNQQKLLVEVSTLKEELKEQILLSKRKNPDKSNFHLVNEVHYRKTGTPKFRHSQWMANLQDTVNGLEFTQTDINRKIQVILENQATSMLQLHLLEKEVKTSEFQTEKDRTNHQRLEVLVNKTEQQTLDIQSRVNNITTSSIETLHDSTMQLFNALERLEGSYEKTTDDIRKEISKLDYNFSQTQSDLEELREQGINTEQIITDMKNSITSLQKSSHVHLQNTSQESQISHNKDEEIEALHRQVIADDKIRWDRKVRESILQFKEDILRLKQHQGEIEQELELFATQLPKDCSGIWNSLGNNVHLIRNPELFSGIPVKALCAVDPSGDVWTVIQKRSSGDQDFNKNWLQYKSGFGDVTSEDFWIGNDFLHHITTSDDYMLRIDLWDDSGKYKYALYDTFRVLDERDNYRLVIAGYSGNASDSMDYHNGMEFSTPDIDNDASTATHCAKFYRSGWWYNHCQYVNINGRYNTGITWYDIDAKEWSELKKVEMKIRPRTKQLVPR